MADRSMSPQFTLCASERPQVERTRQSDRVVVIRQPRAAGASTALALRKEVTVWTLCVGCEGTAAGRNPVAAAGQSGGSWKPNGGGPPMC